MAERMGIEPTPDAATGPGADNKVDLHSVEETWGACGSRAAAHAISGATAVEIVADRAATWKSAAIHTVEKAVLAHLATGHRAATLQDTVAGNTTAVDAAGRTSVVSGAGNHRAVGTLDLDEAAREEQWLWSAGRQSATTNWGKHRGDRAFSLWLGPISEAGRSEGDKTTEGEDEDGFRSHGGLLAKEVSRYRARQRRPG